MFCAGFCLKTKSEKGDKVFINVCLSDQVPSPKDITDDQLDALLESGDPSQYRVPISLGDPHDEVDNCKETLSIIALSLLEIRAVGVYPVLYLPLSLSLSLSAGKTCKAYDVIIGTKFYKSTQVCVCVLCLLSCWTGGQ